MMASRRLSSPLNSASDSAIDSVVAVWYLALDFWAVIFGCLSLHPKPVQTKPIIPYHSLISSRSRLFLFFVFILCIFA